MGSKPCPHCRQDIPADSVRCHHCREWVDWRGPVKRHLLPAVGLLALFLALFVGAMLIMDRAMLREKKFWQQPDAIEVLSHQVGQGEEGGRCVIGTMRNVSETPWRSITIQVDYYNSRDELVDTSEDWSSETLAPNQERSFKVVFKSEQRDVEYDHYRVFIAGADDASQF